MITHIKQVHIEVENINRAVDFYQNVLGLEVLMHFPDQNMAFIQCGKSRFYLSKNDNPEYQSKAFIYYNSNDLESDFEKLKHHKVDIIKEPTVIHKTDSQESWLCAFNDSEGNVLHLMQDKSI